MSTFKNLTIEQIVELILNKEKTFAEVTSKHPDSKKAIITELHNRKLYNFKPGARIDACIKMKNAAEEYVKQGGFPNVSVVCIAKQFKVSAGSLSEYLTSYYPEIKVRGKADFNENVFDTIDTEEKAYWLGFIYADGTISSSPLRKEEGAKVQYQFELSLSSKDYEHLLKFSEFLGYNKEKVFCDDTRCRLSVYSKHLWNVLNCNGCTPQKSLTLRFPKKELFDNVFLIRHFIRGYFDGDGSVCYANKEHTMPAFHLLGTSQFLEQVKHYLNIEDVPLHILHPTEQSITKYIQVGGKKALNLFKILYNDSIIYLDRKYNKYLDFCRSEEKSSELLQSKIGEDCDVDTEITTL